MSNWLYGCLPKFSLLVFQLKISFLLFCYQNTINILCHCYDESLCIRQLPAFHTSGMPYSTIRRLMRNCRCPCTAEITAKLPNPPSTSRPAHSSGAYFSFSPSHAYIRPEAAVWVTSRQVGGIPIRSAQLSIRTVSLCGGWGVPLGAREIAAKYTLA